MKFSLRFAVVAGMCMVPVSGVMAQDLESYATVGVWEVLIDPSVGNGCLINAAFEDGSDIRIGFDREAGTGYLMAMNEAWGDVVEGQTYPITFDLDGTAYDGNATGVILDDLPGVDIPFDSIDFLTGVAASTTMTLLSDGAEVMKIDLTDSDTALAKAIECQDAQG